MNDDTNPTINSDATPAGEASEGTPRGPFHRLTMLLLTFGIPGEQFAAALHEGIAEIAANEDEAAKARELREADLRTRLDDAHERISFEVNHNHAMELRIAALEERLGAPAQVPPVVEPTPAPMLDVVQLPTLDGAWWDVQEADAPTPEDAIILLSHQLAPVQRATAGQRYTLRRVAAG